MNTNLLSKAEFVYNNETHTVLSELENAFRNCNSFFISVAFITTSGVNSLKTILEELEKRGVKGQIITTDYLTFSSPKALDVLDKLTNITLKMYVTNSNNKHSVNKTGFHTKGYIFEKEKDNYTIIIGSSNLTNNAIVLNKEWNTKIKVKKDDSFAKEVLNEFNEYWNSENSYLYRDYRNEYIEQYNIVKAQKEAAYSKSSNIISKETYELKPNVMQIKFINSLRKMISNGAKRALLISATGTGKTYASAFALRELKSEKALFVVHREQIAKQAMKSFNIVFNDSKKTAIFSGTQKDIEGAEYIFATVQTLSKQENLELFDKNEFDTIIIDEAHRAAAKSYNNIFSYFKPKLFLGMTATPDRTDEVSVYKLFDHNIAYEIRLQEALQCDFLCPFNYYGIHELEIPGKENSSLSDFTYIEFKQKADYVLEKIKYYSSNGESEEKVKGLIFCNNRDEAQRYSEYFNNNTDYKTCVLTGEDSQEKRESCIRALESDSKDNYYLDYIFTVDIFNEGIDIPCINQVVMIRKTQSSIIFIQQLGRGLRKFPNKEFVTVIDFVGNYDNNYNIPLALTGDKTYKKDKLRRFIHAPNNFPLGLSTISFDKIVKEKIFRSIDTANFQQKKILVENYVELKNKLGRVPSLIDFYEHGSMDLQCIFSKKDLQSYYTFLKSIKEKDFKIQLNALEERYLQFISSRFANDRRLDEVLILNEILDGVDRNLFSKLESKINCKLKNYQKESLFNILSGQFVTGTGAKKVHDIIFVEKVDDNEVFDIQVTTLFKKMLQNKDFFNLIKEIIDYTIFIYNQVNPDTVYKENSFTLNEMYSYDDVCRLLYWDKSVVALNIGGYKYDEKTNTMPIFVNYHKADDISNSIKYEDEFINKDTLIWFTKSKRNLDSKEVKLLQEMQTNNIKIPLFVRKNNSSVSLGKDDKKNNDSFKEFYYLGLVKYVDNIEETTMLDDNQKNISIVRMNLHLEEKVRDDIYEYITEKL